LTAAVGVGAVAGAVLIGGIGTRLPRPRAAVIGAATLSVAVVLLALSREAFLSLTLLAVAGAAMATQGIATATSLQLAAPNELRGRVMAVYSFVVLGLAPLGAFQAGWVAEHLGAAWSIGLSGGVALIGTAWLSRRLWDGQEEAC
jgi:MFS family permease